MPLNQEVQEEERRRREREAQQAAQQQAMEQATQQQTVQQPTVQQPTVQQPTVQQPSVQQPQSAQQQLQYKQEPQQQNKWYQGSQPTFNESLARIYTISKIDYDKGKQLYYQLMGFASDPTSNFYNPYNSGTNQAIYQLHALGFDMSKGVTKEWIEKNSYLQQYYRTGTSGTPLAPTKKSTREQNAAYWYYQILKAEDTTEKAELEWNALREEIAYWTARQDRNYSDDEILAKIDWSKYKTLVGLDTDRANGTPTKLNRGIGYSQDNLRGVIWAARNGGGTGNAQMDAVKAILGEGKGYTRDESLHGSDDPTSPNYNPYGYASTMDEAAKYFNVYGFGEDWLEKNKGILTGNDETAKKYYQQIASAEKTTKKAEEEWKSLRKDIAYWASRLDRNYTDEEVLAHIDWNKYKTLANLDEDRKTGTPTALTRGIGYSQQGMQDTLDFVRSYGVGYQENEDIRSRRDPTSDKYSPYSVGSTLDDAALYFNVSGFGPQWLEENRAILNSTDATQKAMYKKVYKAEQTTLAAEKELQELWDDVYTKLKFSNDADYILNGLLDGRNTLKRMDESMKYGDLQSGDLLETTRAINYRWQDVEDFVRKACEKQKTEVQGPVYVQNVTDALNGVSTQGTQTTTQSAPASVPQGDTGMVVSSAKDAAAKEAAPTFMTKGTDEEKLVAQWSWPVATPEYISTITDAIQNGTMTGTDVVRQAQYNADSYTAKNYLDILASKGEYQKAQDKADAIRKQIEERRAVLDKQFNEGASKHPFAKDVQEYSDLLQTIDRINEGLDVPKELEQRVRSDVYLHGGDLQAVSDDYRRQLEYAQQSVENYEYTSEDYASEDKELKDLQIRLNAAEEELGKLQQSYDEALEKEKILNGNYDSVAKLAGINAADDKGLRNMVTVMKYIDQVGREYVPTQYTAYSLYDAAMQGDDAASYEQVVSAAKEGQAAYRAAIQNIDYAFKMAERYQVDLPDEYVSNLNRAKARYEREAKAADYFIMRGNEDFASTVEKAKQDIGEAWKGFNLGNEANGYSRMDLFASKPDLDFNTNGNSTTYMYAMTQEERDTYLYIRAKEGADAAKEYYDYLTGDYGVIKTREANRLKENVSAATKSGWAAGVGMNILRAVMAPAELAGTAKAVIDTIAGRETNPYDSAFGPAIFRSTVSQATKEEIDKIDNPTWKTVANIGYDVGSSMADNVVNMVTFGGLGEGIGNAVLSNFVSAVPMALEAAGSTMQSAREAGASQMQMLALGGASFLAESLTEAVTVGNIKDAFTKGTKEEFVHSISQLFIGTLKDMGEEALGEGASEAFEGIMQNLIYSKLDGLSLEDVGEKDLQEILSDSAYAAFLGAISGGVFKVTGDIFTGNTKRAIQMQFIAQTKGMTGSQYADSLNEQISRIREAEANKTSAGEAPQGEVAGPMPQTGPMPQGEVAGPMPQGEATGPKPDADLVSRKVAALNEAMGTEDVASKTTTVAAVLSDGNNDMMQNATMQALSTHLADRIGADESVSLVRDIMMTAAESGINQDALTKALTTAVLGNGGASSMLDVMVNEGVTKDTIGQMMMAAGMDSTNQTVQQAIQKAVEENQIATRTKEIYAETAGQLDNAKTEVSNAKADVQKATTDLEEQHRLFDAFKKKMDTIKDNLLKNAGNQNYYKALEGALGKLESQNTAVKQREQALEDANHRLQEAQGRLDGQENALLQQAREQAQQEVVARNEQYRQGQQEIAEQNALALAQEQAIQDEQSGLTEDNKAQEIARQAVAKSGLTGDAATALQDRIMKRYEQVKSGEVDVSQVVTSAEAGKVLGRMARKLGVQIVTADMPIGRGKYSNGVITLSNKLTLGQAMVEASLHEITHALEGTKAYQKYADLVLAIKYGDGLQAAIQNKLEEYGKKGVDLSAQAEKQDISPEEAAQRELVADFARTDLAKKDVVNRMMDNGLGGTIRNALHNINQWMKNMKLEGQEKIDAENLRKAERLFQKAINQRKNVQTHPGVEQFSIPQFAAAAGLYYDEASETLYDKKGGKEITQITPDMIEKTPIGMMTLVGQQIGNITKEQSDKIIKMFADLLTMCSKYRDTNLVWEIAASTLSSEFSAIKSNADKQYSNTVDFGTVCSKTQALINQLSRDMLKAGRGLTSEEILDVYNDVYNAGLTVPCPVCYVFSRWMGVPSLLESMRKYQNRFLGEEGHEFTPEKTQELVDEFIQGAREKIQREGGVDDQFFEDVAKEQEKAKKKLDRAKIRMAKAESRVATLQDAIANGVSRKNINEQFATAQKNLSKAQETLTKAQSDYDNADAAVYAKVIGKAKAAIESKKNKQYALLEGTDKKTGIFQELKEAQKNGENTDDIIARRNAVWKEIDKLNEELSEVDAYNWVTQALCKMDKDGRFVVDPEFTRTKNEILLDLNRTGEFAKDVKNWKYRCTRGAGMGKSILPFSGASIGDSVYGVDARLKENNPFSNVNANDVNTGSAAFSQAMKDVMSAMENARRQNLIGGQRFQSTSDFRPEWALDYVMTFIEQQVIGSCGQLYTKVVEAVPMLASAGIDCNLSIMPEGNGYHIDKNGKVVLDFSNVTGMDYKMARALKNKYANVQMILVGINDVHIKAALADGDIDFVIPWHASGNSKDTLKALMKTVGETLTTASDYSKVQSDTISAHEKAWLESAKAKLEADEELTEAEENALRHEAARDARKRLLTGKTLTDSDMEIIRSSEFLKDIYKRFKGVDLDTGESFFDPDCNGLALGSAQASQIFPFEYWQIDPTKAGGNKATADENGRRFIRYCQELGMTPRFSGAEDGKTHEEFGNFSGRQLLKDENGNVIGETYNPVEGYWKTLIDRSMYDLEGNYRKQQKIDVTKIKTGDLSQIGENGKPELNFAQPELDENGNLIEKEGGMIPNKAQAKYDTVAYKQAYKKASKAFDTRFGLENVQYDVDQSVTQFSAGGDITDADIEQWLADQDEAYQEAVDNGDTEAAQNVLDGIKEKAGEEAARDVEYMTAVENGDMETAQRMVQEKADAVKAEVFAATDVPTYRIRRDFAPRKTIKVYKTFTLDEQGRPSALFVSSQNAIPVGVWLDAQDTFHFTDTKNGRLYVPSTKNPNTAGGATGRQTSIENISQEDLAKMEELGYVKRDEKGNYTAKNITSLAYRPGWHAGDLPFFPQGGMKIEGSNYENVHRYNQVVFECEMAADTDYTTYDIGEDGKIKYKDMQSMPESGSYKFATNPMANSQDIGAWYISGALKINRALTEAECNQILEEAGYAPQEWQAFQDKDEMRKIKGKENKAAYEKRMGPLDLDALGYDPNQTDGGKKLLDPVTYDDNGNVIPLSERFNPDIEDPRYSIGGDITNADIDQMLVENGLITQEQAETGRSNMPATTGNITIPPNTPDAYTEPGTGPVRQRQFGSQTAQRSDALHDDVKQYLREHSAYSADSNQEQIDRSIEWVRSHASEQDTDGYYAAMEEILDPNFNSMSADGQARMLTVMSMAALKGDVASETRIADAYNQQGTRLGQAMQARKIFNLMTPLGRISMLKKTVNNLNQRYIDQGKSTRINLSEETLKKAGEARTAEEFREVQKQAYKELAEQMPSDWKEKLRSMRYFSMLFNPVTHIRNVLGNAGFMPAIAFKNTIGTGLEHLYQGKIERSGDMRTKALVASKENRAFAKADAIAMKDELTGEAKYNDADPVQQERKMFGKSIFGKAFQGLIDFNSNLLEAEDWAFLRRHYANALSGWMQANNVTPAQMKSDSTLMDQARAYAIQEAQKATYRDASKFASMMSDISRKGGAAGFLVDAALPFKKTPTNILKRGIEYSPIGLMKTVLVDSHKLHLYNQWVKNGSEGNMPSKAISPTQYIDRIASGLSGTGIAAMGALMSAMGWLKVGLDDDDEIAKQNGEQEYALKVSLFGQDVSYTIDWLAPSSMPLFVGASIYNELMADHNNEDALDVAADITDSFLRITEPVFNLSMLDGVNSLLQTSSWGDAGNNITDIGATLLSNYATSFVPTLAGKVAKTMDTTRRETFIESGTSKTKALLERTWQKTLAKVPGATNLLKPYVSPFGEEEKASTVAAVLQNFVSPGYFKTVEISDMEKEMQRLYEATGEKIVVPKQPAKYFQVDGEKLNLNAEQYTTLQKTRGTLAKDLLNQVVSSPEYQIYGDAARVEMIDDAWKYCTEMAKKEVEPNFKLTNWVAGAGDDPLKALITRREEAAKAGYIAQHKTSLLKALDEEDMDTAQASIEGLKKCGKDAKYVKGFVSDHYRPLYIEAMQNNDMDTAMDIQMTLMQMNIGYTKKNFDDWIKNAKKKEEEE